MTPDERDLVTRLFDRLRAADTPAKDSEAQDLIAKAVAAFPSASYLMVQTLLVQDQALASAQIRITELERTLEDARRSPPQQSSQGFLGGLAGTAGPWSRPASQSLAGQSLAGQIPDGPPSASPWGQRPIGGQAAAGGFLRSALTTAAGVAGGALLFQGISNLLSHNAGPFAEGLGQDHAAANSAADQGIDHSASTDPVPASGVESASYEPQTPGYDDGSFDAGDFDGGDV